jgi:hypothetical protein
MTMTARTSTIRPRRVSLTVAIGEVLSSIHAFEPVFDRTHVRCITARRQKRDTFEQVFESGVSGRYGALHGQHQ